MNQTIRIGSVVTHPLFVGPGVVEDIKKDQDGRDIFVIFWQTMGKKAFHSNKSLKIITNE